MFKLWEWAKTLHSQGEGAWEIFVAVRMPAVSQHPLPLLRTEPTASCWCERKQSKPSSSTAPAGSTWLPLSCAWEQQLLLSSCWPSECSHVLLSQGVKIGLNSHWNGWYEMPPCSASVSSWIMLTGKCYTVLIQGVNLSSHWCNLDKNTWKSHLNKTTIWSRMRNPDQITPEFRLQKLGQWASRHHHVRKTPARRASLADTFWNATSSGARPLLNVCGDFIFLLTSATKTFWCHSVLHTLCLKVCSWSTPIKCSLKVTRFYYDTNCLHYPVFFLKISTNLSPWAVLSWQGTIKLSSSKKELYLWTTNHKCYTANFDGQGWTGWPDRDLMLKAADRGNKRIHLGFQK